MIKKITSIIIGFFLLVLPPLGIFNFVYRDRIMPGVTVAGLNLTGKTRAEAMVILQSRLNYFQENGLKVVYEQREWTIKKEDLGLAFDAQKTLDQALAIGHEKNLSARLGQQFFLLASGTQVPMVYDIDAEKFQKYLTETFAFLEDHPVLAKVVLRDHQFSILPERGGVEVNFPKLEAEIKENVAHLSERKIEITLKENPAALTRAGVLNAYQTAQETISRPLRLAYGDKFWTIDQKMISAWLEFKLSEDIIQSDNPPPPYQKQNNFLGDFTRNTAPPQQITQILEVRFRHEDLEAFLKGLTAEIEVEPTNARFRIDNDKVSIFAPGRDGKKINYEETIRRIENAFQTNPDEKTEREVQIAVETIVPSVTNQTIKDLGLVGRIGVGVSDFAGSPANRKHNISVGAEKISGILIPPGEEFSIVEALGEVSAQTGYKPELVIKPEGTIPEFGGGLCQVSTTLFRAAIYTGLPILERKAHKYVVSYYTPTGIDATIYIPHPDLRFQNDTPGHILIQSRIEGTKLYFDFYGTDDGRKVAIEGPIYTSGWIDPGPPEYIETNTLAAGQKKQVERAHKGISTVFHRTVTRNGEEIIKDSYYSKYQPWKAVYLVGPGTPTSDKTSDTAQKPEPKPTPAPAPKPSTPSPPPPAADQEE